MGRRYSDGYSLYVMREQKFADTRVRSLGEKKTVSPRGQKAPTIIDVATKCGYSKSTVSAVLQGSKEIPDATAKKVHAAIKRLGYRQNRFARGLRTRNTMMIGMIIKDYRDPFSAELVCYVEKALFKRGYQLMVSSSFGEPALEKEAIARMIDHHIDGLILLPNGSIPSLENLKLLEEHRTQCVIAGEFIPQVNRGWYSFKCVRAIKDALLHLKKLGHERPAFLLPCPNFEDFEKACELFIYHVNDGDTFIRRSQFVSCGVGAMEACREVIRLFRCKAKSTAIVTIGDSCTIGAMSAFHDLNMSIPRDVSLIGFAGSELSSMLRPRPTIIHQVIQSYSESLADLVTSKRDPDKSIWASVFMEDLTFVLGETTGPVWEPDQVSHHLSYLHSRGPDLGNKR